MSPYSRSPGSDAAASTKAAHNSSALLQAPQTSQEVATAPDEAETEDELDAVGAATADAVEADSLTQQLQALPADGETLSHQHNHGRTSSSSSSRSSTTTKGIRSLWDTAQPLAVKYLAPAVLLLVSLRWLLRKLRGGKQRRQQDQQQQQPAAQAEEPEPTLAVYASDYVLDLPPTTSPRAAVLEGLRCVVAENVAVPGGVLGCGVPSIWHLRPQAAEAAPVIRKLMSMGAMITGQGSTQPCNYPTLGSNIRNPVGRCRVAGGGASGAAVAVAVGDADVAVGADYLGSLRIPAACMGLCSVVCTPGTLGSADVGAVRLSDTSAVSAIGDESNLNSARSSDSSSSIGAATGQRSWRNSASGGGSSSVEPLGFVAAEVGQLCRVASCLGVPGAANLRHEVTQVVVAEDLFQLCEVEMSPGILAVKRAVLVWAGNEQAGSVQLLQFLEANTHNWRRLALPEPAEPELQLPPVLRAIARAAQLLYHSDLAQRYGPALESAVASAANTGADEPDGDEQQAQQQQQQEQLGGLDPMVLAAVQDGAAVTQAELKVAQDVAKELQEVLKGAVKKDVVVVAPCLPSAPPLLGAPAAAQQTWLAHAHAFAALTTLGGCPSVVLPVGSLPDGAPLGLSMFGQSRTDQRLLAVADKLMPHVQAELAKIRQQAAAESAAAAADSGATAAKGKAAGKGAAAGRRSSHGVQVDAKRAERAERAKTRGNEAFKAGRFMDAIKAYSEALKLHPNNPVYANNRAMAYLKVFSFEAAEADCNRALASPQLAQQDRVKALLRRGTARMHKGDLRAARSDFREVLAAEPNNRQAREELKALQQQEQDMEQTRRQHALAAASAAANGGSAGGLPGLPPQLADLNPATAAQLLASGELGDLDPHTLQAAAAAASGMNGGGFAGLGPGLGGGGMGGLGGLTDAGSEEQQLAEMLRSGGMSVVLGQNGQAVSGPSGEPVIVGPDGQELTIEPSGKLRPYKGRRTVGV